jgi:hypothetical protein
VQCFLCDGQPNILRLTDVQEGENIHTMPSQG